MTRADTLTTDVVRFSFERVMTTSSGVGRRAHVVMPLFSTPVVVIGFAPPVSPPAGRPPAEKKTHEVEGTVKKVDPAAKTVDVSSGLLGIMGAKLEVTEETKIQVDGKDATITEIREGGNVKAVYESQAGKNVAKSIEVKPAEGKKEPAASPPTAPGTRPSPPAGPKQ